MIFVTVGTQLAFDRMIKSVDEWAGSRGRKDIFAQVGPGEYKPRNIEFAEFITPAECREKMLAATAIVAHAGMGTILSALEMGKPVLVVPRKAALGEHRNDHQLATARRFAELRNVGVAFDEKELVARLDELGSLAVAERISPHASPRLIAALRTFIQGGPAAQGEGNIRSTAGRSRAESSQA